MSVRDPVWANAEHTRIDCIVRFAEFSEEHSFTACPLDREVHGREIYQRCYDGEFGDIAPFSDQTATPIEPVTNLPRWVSAWPEVHEFIQEANTENARGTARGIGLVWGSMLETMLREFVAGKQPHSDGDHRGPTGRSGGDGFFGLIKKAADQRLLDSDVICHLHAIRKIRNACAHEWKLSVENPAVADLGPHFDLLRSAYHWQFLGNDLLDLMRMVYSAACCQIIIQLAEQMTRLEGEL